MQRRTFVFNKQSLCLSQTGHLYMFDFTIHILYAVMSQPWFLKKLEAGSDQEPGKEYEDTVVQKTESWE